MKNWSKREKILVVVIVILILFGVTGCNDDSPKVEEKSFIKEITVKPIEVEKIEVETILTEEILTETILYEDVSTYWDQ